MKKTLKRGAQSVIIGHKIWYRYWSGKEKKKN